MLLTAGLSLHSVFVASLGERLNTKTIAIVSGNPNATYLTIRGRNISDVRFLKGVDLGITQSIILNDRRAVTNKRGVLTVDL